MSARTLFDVTVVCLLLLASDTLPHNFAATPLDGITWSPYRPVYGREHHIPMRTYVYDAPPPEWI